MSTQPSASVVSLSSNVLSQVLALLGRRNLVNTVQPMFHRGLRKRLTVKPQRGKLCKTDDCHVSTNHWLRDSTVFLQTLHIDVRFVFLFNNIKYAVLVPLYFDVKSF